MRLLPMILLGAAVSGCAPWLPRHDPAQAWIDLAAPASTQVRASAVDEQPLDDPRFFQIEPGSHRLDMRYLFEVSAANVGATAPALQRDCRLALDYEAFQAGSRYRLQAGANGFRPWARLYDEQGRLLASAREEGCLRS